MNNIKVPGILWTVLIAVAIILIETYLAPGYQLYAEGAIVVLMGAAKAFNLGTKEIDDLLAMLRRLQRTMPVQESGAVLDVEKHEPNKVARWLVG